MKLKVISGLLVAGALWTAVPMANAAGTVPIQELKLVAEKGDAAKLTKIGFHEERRRHERARREHARRERRRREEHRRHSSWRTRFSNTDSNRNTSFPSPKVELNG